MNANPGQTTLVQLQAVPMTGALLESLAKRGLIALFRPTPGTQNPPPGDNSAEALYVSSPEYGPHKLIAVGVGKTEVRLGVHPDNEEFLIPVHSATVRPLFLVIAHLPVSEIQARDKARTLSPDDFTCLNIYPPNGASAMFTMLAGTVHCEVTVPGGEPVGCFYVTESRDLPITWVDLEQCRIEVA